MKTKFSLNKLLENNKYLRIFSVIISILLYIVVSMTENDSRTVTVRGVPVSLDQQAATLQNLRLSVIDKTDFTVDVEVNGPRTDVAQLQPDDPQLATTVRISQITQAGTYNLPIVSTATNTGNLPYKIVKYSPSTIQVRLDRIVNKSFDVKHVVMGLNSSPGFVYGDQTVTPQKVMITGPETEVEKIVSAQVSVDLTEPLENTFADSLPIILLDAQGKEIAPEKNYLTLDKSEAQLVLTVLKETDLPLAVEFTIPPRDFPLEELRECLTMSNYEVKIAGPPDVIDKQTEILLGVIDIKTLLPGDNSHAFSLGLEEIDDRIKSMDNVTSVTATFDDSKWDIQTFNITDILPVSPPMDYDVELLSTRIDGVQFVGNADILETMTSADIVAEVDLADRDLTVGQYNYPVKFSVPGKGLVWAVGDHTTIIKVSEKQ